MPPKCPRPSLSEDNSPSSPNLTIHPPPQPGPGLMNSHNHTLIQSHTHTIRSSSSRKEQIQKLPLSDAQVPSAGAVERPTASVESLHKLANLSYRPKKQGSSGTKVLLCWEVYISDHGGLMQVILPFMGNSHGHQASSWLSRFIMSHNPLRIWEHVSAQGFLKQQLQPPTKPAGSRGSKHLV